MQERPPCGNGVGATQESIDTGSGKWFGVAAERHG
jgi:hypothetical protein